MLQPEARPITREELAAEVKGIYAGLVMLESKCIKYDSSQKGADRSMEQYHALISLHRLLLHEYHDFFLASQHPSASNARHWSVSKYTMSTRMWRHSIHSSLELLRQKLPESREHIYTFIYISYAAMVLLYEIIPAFQETWIECLGDLARYRMAIEDDDIRDRENWTTVSRHWYTAALDTSPPPGRLHHHLAILARPNAVQQLHFYAKSLCVAMPFLTARHSIINLFDPLLHEWPNTSQRVEPLDAAFVRVHGILFSGGSQFESSKEQLLDILDMRVRREHENWRDVG